LHGSRKKYNFQRWKNIVSRLTHKTRQNPHPVIAVENEPLTDEERDREMALALQKQLDYHEAQQLVRACSKLADDGVHLLAFLQAEYHSC
jgi:hypothetical protein